MLWSSVCILMFDLCWHPNYAVCRGSRILRWKAPFVLGSLCICFQAHPFQPTGVLSTDGLPPFPHRAPGSWFRPPRSPEATRVVSGVARSSPRSSPPDARVLTGEGRERFSRRRLAVGAPGRCRAEVLGSIGRRAALPQSRPQWPGTRAAAAAAGEARGPEGGGGARPRPSPLQRRACRLPSCKGLARTAVSRGGPLPWPVALQGGLCRELGEALVQRDAGLRQSPARVLLRPQGALRDLLGKAPSRPHLCANSGTAGRRPPAQRRLLSPSAGPDVCHYISRR